MQLKKSLELVAQKGGAVIYIYQEGRGVGLLNKIRAMEIERTQRIDTVDAFQKLHFDLDSRNYDIAIIALKDLKINENIKLITNNPRKIKQLKEAGFSVERVSLSYPKTRIIKEYLRVKKEKLGHEL